MKTFLIAFILLAIACNAHRHKHQCVHDKITESFKPILNEDLSDQDRQHRMLQYTQTRPIKIVIDDSNMSGVTAEQRDLIVGKLVPVSTEFLSRRLTVYTKGSPLKVDAGSCYQATIPANHRNVGLDADLVIYVTASNEPNEGFIAWATACIQDSVTLRPIAGQINFNLHYLSFDPIEFEEQIDTTIHEITHILGFSGNLYRHFTKSFESHERRNINDVFSNQAVIRGKKRQVLKTPKILETARKYFDCPTIDGVEIENEGGSGSAGAHWERAILHNEQMTSSSIPDASYSEFTLSILHDSGWYKVDFSRAEPMFYGEKAGCEFITTGCSAANRREWCNGESNLCSFNYKYKSTCRSETFSDGCKYAMGYGNGNCQVPSNQRGDASGETYGPSSKCVMGSIKDKKYQDGPESTLCYRYTCTSDGKIKFLPSGGGEILCSRAGEIAQASGNYKGTIRCPDPVSFCRDYYPSCPNSCSSKGYCVRGKCECRAGFSGDDCSVGVDVPTPAPTDFCKNVVCPPNSSCNQGTCLCNRGFEGPECKPVDPCTLIKCPTNGWCEAGKCKCMTGFQGPNCDPIPVTKCPNNCSNNGECRDTTCVCRTGFSGNDCSISSSTNPVNSQCPSNCNNRGTCYGNVCKCLEGFSGPACETANNGASGSCPNNCYSTSERGWCAKSTMKTNGVVTKIEYKCKCNSGFSGPNCGVSAPPAGSLCPLNCGPKGSCDPNTRKCVCSSYIFGDACEIEACINWCDGGTCSYNSKRVNGVEVSKEYFCRCKDGSTKNRFCL